MPDTVSFLNTTFKDIRCQNPACQAVASYDNRITLENLLYTGWTCPQRDCGWVHEGAFADPDKIPILPEYGATPDVDEENDTPLTDEQVEEEIDKLAEAPPIETPRGDEKKPSLKDRVLKKGDADA